MEKNDQVRHVLGISGGKDSAALAVYLKEKHPELDIEYYFSDTGKELEETYQVLNNLENFLGKSLIRLKGAEQSPEDAFDHYLKMYGGFLPSTNARWCTKKLKLEPFENFIGDDPVISYVGIRGDEDREGYISTKENIQSIFPFRKNIWSVDVTRKILKNAQLQAFLEGLEQYAPSAKREKLLQYGERKVQKGFNLKQKIAALLDIDTVAFNQAVFHALKGTDYPVARLDDFPLLYNEDVLVRNDIFNKLEESGVGVPQYYNLIEFEVDGKKGYYQRSRSGCYFCFFQQKIEWVWLLEQHPDLFQKAMEYEKEGYTWMEDETLENLAKEDRVQEIKRNALKRFEEKKANSNSPYLTDILEEAEGEGCAACFL